MQIGSDPELLSEFQFACVHLAGVSFVVVPAEMEDAVEDKLFDLGFEREVVLGGLLLGLFGGDHDVTEI